MDNPRRHQRSRKKLLFQCMGANLAYSVLIFLLMWVVMGFCNQVIWYWENPVYRLLKFIEQNLPLFVVPILLCGWMPITYHYIARILGRLDEVTQAAEQLAVPGQEPIHLSEDLADVEKELNRVREQALRNAQAAREAEQRKQDLVVYLAHDLKTPLTSVLGYLTLLRDEPQISEELRQKYLGIALGKAERLEDLTNEFFEITRFKLSEIGLDIRPVNLSRLLEQLVFEFQPMLGEKALSCRLDIPPDTVVPCDANQIQRVFDNLLQNAVNYSSPQGEIRLVCAQEEGQLRLTVSNPGPTIPPEQLSHIFEQFYRVDRARGTATGGTGLGLAIAREIVRRHGGTLTAESEEGWIAFTVSLPL